MHTFQRFLTGSAARSVCMDWSWLARIVRSSGQPLAAPDCTARKLGLVLLNTPLSEQRLRRLWESADVRVCADGAANTLRDTCKDLVPDVIVGDFDSVACDVLEFYERGGSTIRNLSDDQDTTDLQKALKEVHGQACDRVVVAGQFAGVMGRLDHTFGIINALFMAAPNQVAVVSDDSAMFLLCPGEHRIVVPDAQLAPHCGLVPVGEPCTRITTTGLRWNSTDGHMEFGGLISVCNRVDPTSGGRVWVSTDTHVLWTCTLSPP